MTAFDTEFSEAGEIESGTLHLDETYWGYIIRSGPEVSSTLQLLKAMAWLAGVGFYLAAVGVWLMPEMMFGGNALMMKGLGSALMVSIAVLLGWFARQGHVAEVQVDCAQSELREVMRDTRGRGTLIGRHRFQDIGAVFIDRTGADRGRARLLIRLGGSAVSVPIAQGRVERLEHLRDRLGRDLLEGKAARLRR